MTPTQQMRVRGFNLQLIQRGHKFQTDKGVQFSGLIQDMPIPDDGISAPRAEVPVYVEISALAGAIPDAREPEKFFLLDDEGKPGRAYKVLRYPETAADMITWKWFCEAFRA